MRLCHLGAPWVVILAVVSCTNPSTLQPTAIGTTAIIPRAHEYANRRGDPS